jgi:hypothetical protein
MMYRVHAANIACQLAFISGGHDSRQNPRDRAIALCYASKRLACFSYGNSCAEIQDTVPLHLECE